ncbi:thioredoxin-like protein [Stereum hirsutum FP-91666 SS1]|uniref:thioredoxin-like protein n=1 Tax=Stereum hirsutum (strain FP-91666) TaxID=721885 RepID=UPI0004449DF8|nr:thioredoxin-like protein [Stereum hirsutum FP-91666 SS1]EIM81300.1 thioredoxin-like protein [Stereum hirsutum FP-91666 SS1]
MDDIDVTQDVELRIYEKGDQSVGRLSGGEREWKGRRRVLDGEVPVVVFSKTYCPYSKGAKTLLAKYDLSPAPHIVELDLRDDAPLLKTLLTRLTGRGTVPNIILKGRSIGGFDTLNELHRDGKLKGVFEKAGVVVRGEVDGQ